FFFLRFASLIACFCSHLRFFSSSRAAISSGGITRICSMILYPLRTSNGSWNSYHFWVVCQSLPSFLYLTDLPSKRFFGGRNSLLSSIKKISACTPLP